MAAGKGGAGAVFALVSALGAACGGAQAEGGSPTSEVELPPAGSSPVEEGEAGDRDGADSEQRAARTGAKSSKAMDEPREPGDLGFITIVCNPYCDDIVEAGRSLGPSPLVHAAAGPGVHHLTANLSGAPSVAISIVVQKGKTTSVEVILQPPPGHPPYPPQPAIATAQTLSALPPPPNEVEIRKKLEPKVWSGKASVDEIRLLKLICSHMGDRACRDRANALLKRAAPPPSR